VSYRASIPSMFGKENLTKINTLLVRLGAIMSIIGFTAGGFISAFFSYKYLLVFDGIMYIGSAIVLLKVRWIEPSLLLRTNEQRQASQNIIMGDGYLFLLIGLFTITCTYEVDFINNWNLANAKCFNLMLCSLNLAKK